MGGAPNMGCTNNFYYETYDDKNAIAYLRQENKKLFCRYKENINVEFLLYNFDLNPKDTFKFYSDKSNTNYYVSTVIDSVDSILIDSGYRKVLYLSDGFYCGMGSGSHKIIEGIGSDHGLFEFCNSEFDSYHLNCFSMNGHSVYPTIDTSSCKIILGVKKMNSDQIGKILIYPNPTHDFITIENKHIIGQVDIYDIHGQMILSCQNSNTVNISNLKEGIYLVKLTNHKTNDVEYLKFIKN